MADYEDDDDYEGESFDYIRDEFSSEELMSMYDWFTNWYNKRKKTTQEQAAKALSKKFDIDYDTSVDILLYIGTYM